MQINGTILPVCGGSGGVVLASVFEGIHWTTITEVVVYAAIGAVIGYFVNRLLNYAFRTYKHSSSVSKRNRKKHFTYDGN